MTSTFQNSGPDTARPAERPLPKSSPGAAHTVDVVGLSCGYDGVPILRDVNLSLRSGQVICLLGPNGAGKTTLFKTLLGFLKPIAGSIALDGEDVSGWPRKRYGLHFGYIPQMHAPSFSFTVLEMVLMGRTPHLNALGTVGREDERIAREALDELGLSHLAQRDFTTLSGGERQMVLVARVLAQRSSFLVMDEPTSALDLGNQARVLECAQALAARGIGVIMTTHDPNQAFLLDCDVVRIGHDGTAESGPACEVLDETALAELYGRRVAIGTAQVDGRTLLSCAPVIRGTGPQARAGGAGGTGSQARAGGAGGAAGSLTIHEEGAAPRAADRETRC